MVVPGHWTVEVASALQVNVRRGRISLEAFDTLIEELSTFNISIDSTMDVAEIETLVRFGLQRQLTAYDAAYVMLAAKHGAPLATLDQAMRRSAAELEIELIPA
jgi:predicted nucleic acid-binding protein